MSQPNLEPNLATFCAYAFSHMNIRPDGRASLCCRIENELISVNGRDLSLHHETFDEIWNSRYMQETRRRMVSGEPVAACAGCYQTERQGGRSLRAHANSSGTIANLMEARTLEEAHRIGEAIVSAHDGLAPPPSSLHLWFGNLCNLKCRMCSAMFSSQIAADVVHSRWQGHLERKVVLLPDFLNGVDYEDFGGLEQWGDTVCRLVEPGQTARISFPQSGDPVGRMRIAGFSEATVPCHLVITLGDELVLNQVIDGPQWSVDFELQARGDSSALIAVGIKVDGARAKIGVRNLTLYAYPALGKAHPREPVSRLPENPSWYDNEEVIMKEIMGAPDRLRFISFAGGEPLLHSRIEAILQLLVDQGVSKSIGLFFSTNGTQKSPKVSELLTQFSWVGMGFSFDGVGTLQEYIRPPSRWSIVSGNMLRYRDEGIAQVKVHPTPQAYNVFGLMDLVEFCDKMEVEFLLENILYSPRHLSFDMLPQGIVDEALDEWRNYRATRCRPDRIGQVDTLIAALSRPRPADIKELQSNFVHFTNEMDESRGESLKLANPRLYDRLVAEGVVF